MRFARLCRFAAILSFSLMSLPIFAQTVTPLPIVKFSKAVTFTGYAAVFQAVADLNGDGHLDVVVAEDDAGVGVMLGNGDGTFQAPVSYSTGGFTRSPIAIADLDGDGKLDLVVIDGVINKIAV